MKQTFTLLKITRTLLLALCCMLGAQQAMAQYTATMVESSTTGSGYYSALAKDNSGNLYVVRYNGSTYELVKWANGNPASSTTLVSSLDFSSPEFPWGIAVNSTNGDVFVISANTAVGNQILRVPGGTGTPAVVQTGRRYSTICLDNSNNLLAVETIGGSTYQVTRYAADGSGSGTVLYNGITVPNPVDGTYPTGIDTDSDGNIYVTNFYTSEGIIKLAAPSYTRTNLQPGRHFTGLIIDASNTMYTVEAITSGSPTYRVMKYTDPASSGTQVYSNLVTDVSYLPWGIVEHNGIIYVNDGAATTGVNGATGITGQVLRLSPPSTTVSSVVRVNTTPTNAASVQYTVTFSSAATNVTTSAFTLTTTGVSGASVTSVSGSGTTYTVTVNTGTGSGTLRLNVTGTDMGNTVTNAPYTAGEVYTIDKTPPTGSVVINTGAAYAANAAVNLTITSTGATQMEFSQDDITYSGYVAVAASSSFTFTGADGTRTVYMHLRDATGNVTTVQDDIILDTDAPETSILSGPPAIANSSTATFTFSSDEVASFEADLGSGYAAVANPLTLTGLAEGPHTINVRAVDQAGNTDATPSPYSWTIDLTAPTITAVAVPANGYYKAGDVLSFTVNFDENVIVTGTPSIPVTIGATTVQANYASGSGTSALVFTYTVLAGQMDMDGIAVGAAIALNGGTIRDAATNNAVLTLNSIGNTANVRVNTSIPSVTLSGTPVLNAPWTMTITFSEAVTGFALGDITTVNATMSNLVTSDNITYTALVTPTADGAVDLRILANVAVNIGGNGNTASNIITYTYDGSTPGITSVTVPTPGTYLQGDVLSFTVNYTENVTVTGTPSLPVTIGATTVQANYVSGSGSGALVFTYTVLNGNQDLDGIALGAALQLNGGTIADGTANNANLTLNGVGNTSAVLVDALAPVVSSVTVPIDGYYLEADPLEFTVNFPENVVVTGTPSISVTIGITVVQATYVSGSGSGQLVFSYTVQPGNMDMDGITVGSVINLNLGTIRDVAGNNAVLTLNSVGNTNNIFVNTTVPSVVLSGTPVLNGPWTMTITFSEAVSGFVLADINAPNATISNLSTSDNITFTALVTPVADGPVDIDVPSNVAQNAGGNGNGNSASNTISYTYDATAPAITSVDVPANGVYVAGDALDFTVHYSEDVTVTGTPSLPVTIGATTVQAAYTGGSGTNALTFSYTVLTGQSDVDGIALGTALALNGGTMADASDNNAGLTVNNAGNTSAVQVDAVAPTVTSVNVPANGYYKAGDVLSFTVNFGENVTITGTPSIPVTIGAATVQANYVSGSGGSALVFTYTVLAGQMDMNGIAVGAAIALNGGTIEDAQGNDAVLTLNSIAPTNNVFVNTSVPGVTLSGTPVLNAPWTMTITFSEAVTGFVLGDITATNATLGAFATSDNITYTVLVTPVANGAVSLSVPASVAQNIGGNDNTASNTINYTYDGSGPVITSVTVPANGTYSTGDALSFTVNFDENVVVTGTPSFPVTIGATAVQATYTSGSGTSALTFAYTVQTGEYDADGIAVGATIALNGGTLKDVATNNAVLALNSIGNTSAVLVDAVAPVVTSVTVPANGYYKAGDVLNFTVSFNENVTVTGTPSVPVTIGTATAQAAYTAGSGTNALAFSYTVQPGDMDMDGIAVGAALVLNGGTIKDGLGNDAALALNNVSNSSGVLVNTSIPSVVLSGTPVANAPWTMTITFSEAVTGFALADITAVNAAMSDLATSDNITYTALVTPVADGAVNLRVLANVALNIGGNGNSASNIINYIYDGTGPVIASVAVPANGTYISGDVLSFTVNFDENVTVTGTPSLAVVIGATTVEAAYTAGSGTNALTFAYTVLAGQNDADGISLGAALALNGGAIKDAATNDATLTLNGVGNTSAVLVDAVGPVVTAVSVPADGYYKTGDQLDFTVQFSENITVAGSNLVLPLTIGTDAVQATLFATAANSITFRYVVLAGQLDLDGITVGNAIVSTGGTIKDGSGNDAVLTLNNVANTSNVRVNALTPGTTISGSGLSVTAPWTVTIIFTDAVTGFTASDVTATNATISNLQTTDNITYTALVTPAAEGAVSLQVPANVAQNVSGTGNTLSNTLSYYHDPNPPVITSVEVPANGYYTAGNTLNFAINWNEVVRVDNTPSLSVAIGTTTVQAAYTGGSNSNRLTFAYTVQAGEMDLDGIAVGALSLDPGDRIFDVSGNSATPTLNNVASTAGVFVHTGRPSVTLTTAAATRVNAPFTVTLTFNEAVTQLALADFTLANATVSSLQTTDNITYTVLVTPVADGTVSISLPADAAVNIAGTGNTASNTITRTYDATPPVIAAAQSFTTSPFSPVGTVVGTVTASDASGTLLNWGIASDGSGGAFAINGSGAIVVADASILSGLAGTDVTLGITVSDGLNTSASVPVIIQVNFVNQAPTLGVIANVAMCVETNNHTIQLTGASATEPGQTYTITASANRDVFDVLTVGAGNVLNYRLKAGATAGPVTVAVTIRDNGGTAGGGVDSLRRTFTLTINALPAITITSDKGTSISKGDVVKLTAAGAATYVWAAADGIISGQNTAVLEVKPMLNTAYEVTGTSNTGCVSTGSISLSVVEDFKVDATNILSPNGDGINDRWVIRKLDAYPDNEVKIFDRAGRLIYTRKNYTNDWDGTVNGSPLAEGTYYYILTIGNGARTTKGYITIVRDRY